MDHDDCRLDCHDGPYNDCWGDWSCWDGGDDGYYGYGSEATGGDYGYVERVYADMGPYTGNTGDNANVMGGGSNDAFYVFTPEYGATYVFSTCGSEFDTMLRFYSVDDTTWGDEGYAYSSSNTHEFQSDDDTGEGFCTRDDCTGYNPLETVSMYLE